MNMKQILINILTIILCFSSILTAQKSNSEVDSILNAYERKYRIVLNKSDHLLVADQINRIGTNCMELEKIVFSNEYSNNYKIHLLIKYDKWTTCPNIILEFIDLIEDIGDEHITTFDFSNYSNYPIYQKIMNNKEYREFFSSYLSKSDFLASCSFFIKKRSLPKLKMISSLINSKILNIKTKDSCKHANIILLKGIENNGNEVKM